MGNVVGALQLDVLGLKGAEVLAHGPDLGGFGGVVLRDRAFHRLLQILQHAVQVVAILPLTGLALEDHGLRELLADPNDGVQGAHGILEDHGDLVAADLVEVLLRDLQKILAVIDDLAALDDGVAREYAQDGFGGYGFAGTGLADDRQRFALIQIKIDIPNGMDASVGSTEGDRQPSNL